MGAKRLKKAGGKTKGEVVRFYKVVDLDTESPSSTSACNNGPGSTACNAATTETHAMQEKKSGEKLQKTGKNDARTQTPTAGNRVNEIAPDLDIPSMTKPEIDKVLKHLNPDTVEIGHTTVDENGREVIRVHTFPPNLVKNFQKRLIADLGLNFNENGSKYVEPTRPEVTNVARETKIKRRERSADSGFDRKERIVDRGYSRGERSIESDYDRRNKSLDRERWWSRSPEREISHRSISRHRRGESGDRECWRYRTPEKRYMRREKSLGGDYKRNNIPEGRYRRREKSVYRRRCRSRTPEGRSSSCYGCNRRVRIGNGYNEKYSDQNTYDRSSGQSYSTLYTQDSDRRKNNHYGSRYRSGYDRDRRSRKDKYYISKSRANPAKEYNLPYQKSKGTFQRDFIDKLLRNFSNESKQESVSNHNHAPQQSERSRSHAAVSYYSRHKCIPTTANYATPIPSCCSCVPGPVQCSMPAAKCFHASGYCGPYATNCLKCLQGATHLCTTPIIDLKQCGSLFNHLPLPLVNYNTCIHGLLQTPLLMTNSASCPHIFQTIALANLQSDTTDQQQEPIENVSFDTKCAECKKHRAKFSQSKQTKKTTKSCICSNGSIQSGSKTRVKCKEYSDGQLLSSESTTRYTVKEYSKNRTSSRDTTPSYASPRQVNLTKVKKPSQIRKSPDEAIAGSFNAALSGITPSNFPRHDKVSNVKTHSSNKKPSTQEPLQSEGKTCPTIQESTEVPIHKAPVKVYVYKVKKHSRNKEEYSGDPSSPNTLKTHTTIKEYTKRPSSRGSTPSNSSRQASISNVKKHPKSTNELSEGPTLPSKLTSGSTVPERSKDPNSVRNKSSRATRVFRINKHAKKKKEYSDGSVQSSESTTRYSCKKVTTRPASEAPTLAADKSHRRTTTVKKQLKKHKKYINENTSSSEPNSHFIRKQLAGMEPIANNVPTLKKVTASTKTSKECQESTEGPLRISELETKYAKTKNYSNIPPPSYACQQEISSMPRKNLTIRKLKPEPSDQTSFQWPTCDLTLPIEASSVSTRSEQHEEYVGGSEHSTLTHQYTKQQYPMGPGQAEMFDGQQSSGIPSQFDHEDDASKEHSRSTMLRMQTKQRLLAETGNPDAAARFKTQPKKVQNPMLFSSGQQQSTERCFQFQSAPRSPVAYAITDQPHADHEPLTTLTKLRQQDLNAVLATSCPGKAVQLDEPRNVDVMQTLTTQRQNEFPIGHVNTPTEYIVRQQHLSTGSAEPLNHLPKTATPIVDPYTQPDHPSVVKMHYDRQRQCTEGPLRLSTSSSYNITKESSGRGLASGTCVQSTLPDKIGSGGLRSFRTPHTLQQSKVSSSPLSPQLVAMQHGRKQLSANGRVNATASSGHSFTQGPSTLRQSALGTTQPFSSVPLSSYQPFSSVSLKQSISSERQPQYSSDGRPRSASGMSSYCTFLKPNIFMPVALGSNQPFQSASLSSKPFSPVSSAQRLPSESIQKYSLTGGRVNPLKETSTLRSSALCGQPLRPLPFSAWEPSEATLHPPIVKLQSETQRKYTGDLANASSSPFRHTNKQPSTSVPNASGVDGTRGRLDPGILSRIENLHKLLDRQYTIDLGTLKGMIHQQEVCIDLAEKLLHCVGNNSQM